MFLLMQSIIFQNFHTSPESEQTSQFQETAIVPPSSQTAASQPPALVFVPSAKLQSLSVVTLGKMCLQHEDKAKKIIPAFGQILESSSDPAMKNNMMYVLTDMCVRYASIVDPLLPQMTSCLKDKYFPVRRTTLINLIHLLQEDYLKIRGNGKFFFRLLHTLLDPSEEIRHLTTFYIQQRMLKRFPNIMYTFFAESIFHFNNFTEHSSFNKFTVTEKERQLFDLSGEQKREKRRSLYKFMLENMDDEHRFKTTYKLCQDILNGVVEENIKISPSSLPLIQDAFHCLSSDAIKLASLKTKTNEDDTEADQAGLVLEAGKKALISGVVKKNNIEIIIPIVIALKHKLESARSPLLKDLYIYLRKLMEDYKTEVKEILAADKQLANEIEFDLRRHEQEEQEREERLARERRKSRSNPSSPAGSPARTEGSSRSPRSASASSPSTPTAGKTGRSGRRDLVRQALLNAAQQAPTSGGQQDGSRNRSRRSRQLNSSTEQTLVENNGENNSKETTLVPEAGETNEEEEGGAKTSEGDQQPSNSQNSTVAENTNKDVEAAVQSSSEPAAQEQPESSENQNDPEEAEQVGESEKESDGVNIENDDENDPGEDDAEQDDHDKSKRVSGQGMPRPRTPRARRAHNVRAISTPQASKTVLGDNVTFRQDESSLDLSAITVLSPQSSINVPVSRRGSESQAGTKDDTDAVSFRFKRGGRDMFDKLVDSDTGAAASGKELPHAVNTPPGPVPLRFPFFFSLKLVSNIQKFKNFFTFFVLPLLLLNNTSPSKLSGFGPSENDFYWFFFR